MTIQELKYEMEQDLRQEAYEKELLRTDYEHAEECLVGNQIEMKKILEFAEKLAKNMNEYNWTNYSKEDVLNYAKGL